MLILTSLIGFGASGALFVNPTTSYANAGGTGDRTATITVTKSGLTWDAGADNNLVDGGVGTNATDSVDEPSTSATGDLIIFDFGSGASKFIDEIKLITSAAATHNATWQFQGSRDGVTYEDLRTTTFTWGTGTTTVTLDQPNGTSNKPGWRYIRLVGGASSVWANNWFEEVQFKLADAAY